MSGQTVILRGPEQRRLAMGIIARAPDNAVVNVREEKRTLDQNALLWAILSDVARAKPDGRVHPAETWKALFMNACGHETKFEIGLTGEPFPVGFRSSRMNKSQMSELVEFIYSWGSERGVKWSEPEERKAT